MADDARTALERLNLHCRFDHAPDPDCEGCRAIIDTLIAAVRAEKLPAVTCINCGHRMEAFFRDEKPLR